jgi:hypothetical protein
MRDVGTSHWLEAGSYWSMKRFSDDESYEGGGGGGTLVFFGKVSPSSNRHLCSNGRPANPLYSVSQEERSIYCEVRGHSIGHKKNSMV